MLVSGWYCGQVGAWLCPELDEESLGSLQSGYCPDEQQEANPTGKLCWCSPSAGLFGGEGILPAAAGRFRVGLQAQLGFPLPFAWVEANLNTLCVEQGGACPQRRARIAA